MTITLSGKSRFAADREELVELLRLERELLYFDDA